MSWCLTELSQRHLFNAHFPGQTGQGGTRMSPFWILFELRMMEAVVKTGVAWHANLQSNRHHNQINTNFFTGRVPFLSPNEQRQSSEEKVSHSTDLFTPSSPGYISTLSLTTKGSWLPRRRIAKRLQPSDAGTPSYWTLRFTSVSVTSTSTSDYGTAPVAAERRYCHV